jgi:hypothetical protein
MRILQVPDAKLKKARSEPDFSFCLVRLRRMVHPQKSGSDKIYVAKASRSALLPVFICGTARPVPGYEFANFKKRVQQSRYSCSFVHIV